MQHVLVEWKGDRRFDSGRPGGPVARIDGNAETGQSPTDALLTAVATCSAIDVVDILTKRRTPPERLSVDIRGTRRETPPRRYTHITVRFVIDGAGIDVEQAERAIALSFEKYCSVSASLAPDIEFRSVLVLNGEERAAVAL